MADPTRRALIAAAAALPLVAVAGCNGVDVLASPPRPAPDVGLLRAAIAAEQLLVTQYAAVLRGLTNSGAGASTALAAALAPLLGQHRAHLAELRSRMIVPAGSASPSPSPRATRAPVVPTAPAAEQAAATAMLGRLAGASASLAQLLASISASEATHVPALDDAVRDAPGLGR